ncbi:MAG: protease complex subunit PrcB family protein, partial [Deltaproteobacteria bacterium]|nr:protease complex subunit PrcB family protein [Deltaproteobacteria bacterium]
MKTGFILVLGLFGAILAPACSSTVSLAQTPVPFTTVGKGFSSGVREPLQVVIGSQEEWAALWSRHASGRRPASSPPLIDFSAEMVVGLFLGQKGTGGYSVEITRAELDGANLKVFYRERNPPPGAMLTQALTQPYH